MTFRTGISWQWVFAFGLVVAMGLSMFPLDALAQTIAGATCSHDPEFDLSYTMLVPGDGLISGVVSDLQDILFQMGWYLYVTIFISAEFRSVATIALTIYIIIYGIFFTFGLLQFTLYDFLARMIKIGLIIGFLEIPLFFWWHLFMHLTHFFSDGTDAIIGKVVSVPVGGISVVYDPNYPFAILDEVIAKMVSAKMAVTMLATLFTGPYGLIFGLLLLFASSTFVMALFTAMWVYLMAMVLRTLLLALTPLFLLFLLFDKTRHLFNGWLNQLVNTCLQPILMFTFFAFFATLISASIENLLETPVCWTKIPEAWRGGPTDLSFWRFAIDDPPGSHNWKLFDGLWSWIGPETNPPDPNVSPFPIKIMDILIFLMLAELAGRFNGVVITIARDLAGASTDFSSMHGPLAQWFAPDKGADTNLANNVGRRNTPGGVGYAGPKGAEALEDVKRGINRQGALDYVQKISDNMGNRDS
jgi:type IV secretory pathway VirB6-like protein